MNTNQTTKTKHTPGPWIVRLVHGCHYVCDSMGNSLANLGGEAESDADVMAAAPDLLEIAIAVADDDTPHASTCTIRAHGAAECNCFKSAARAAISKAEGEPNA